MRARRCNRPGCPTVLSRYNTSQECWLHSPARFDPPEVRRKPEGTVATLRRAEHGSNGGYQAGCRCDPCRNAARVARAQQRARAAEPPHHGTENGYRNYLCRCEPCRAAGSVANRRDRERQEGEGVGMRLSGTEVAATKGKGRDVASVSGALRCAVCGALTRTNGYRPSHPYHTDAELAPLRDEIERHAAPLTLWALLFLLHGRVAYESAIADAMGPP